MATPQHKPMPGGKTLELTMRDAQLGLLDTASHFAFVPSESCFEILSIEPPPHPSTIQAYYPNNNVAELTSARSQDIVSFLIRREVYLTQQQIHT